MKKIFALLITAAMLLSMGAVVASAEVPPVPWTPGNFAVADAADFSPVGEVTVTWDPDASKKLDLSDGDMSDWADAGYNMITIDASNMVSWVGGAAGEIDPAMPEGWGMSTYFVMDSEYLYIGFYVTDPGFAYGTASQGYNGDAFQVCIDFGGKLGDAVRNDPDSLTNPKNIFYSFTCVEDGAPLEIHLQESDQNGMLSEANGDGVKGAARATETGWAAEFALSIDMMYKHYVWKAWEDDPKIYVGGDEERPLKIGCALYYLNREEPAGAITWAAGTSNGVLLEDGVTPGVSWTCYDNGIQLVLPIEDDMTFACENVIVIPKSETIPPETEAPETEAPETEAPTAAPETEAPATEAPAGTEAPADTKAPETTPAATEGCASVVGMGVVAVLAAAAAVVALKKKED